MYSAYNARITAAARANFNLEHGLEIDDRSWDGMTGEARAAGLARAAAMVAAIDAADDRIRLTMPEFNAIRADAVRDLNRALHQDLDSDRMADARSAGVPDFIADYAAKLSESHLEPVDHEEAMASLIRERLAVAMRSTADYLDSASLEDITFGMVLDAGVTPRFQRIMIRGCAEWLRTRAGELESTRFRPYRRVNTRAIIDEDRHTALLGVLGEAIRRSKAIAGHTRSEIPFMVTANLVEAIEGVGATIPEEAC